MSVSSIPEWVKLCLWGKAGGRCEYDGCNHPLYRDDVTKAEFNSAYIAHIIADKPTGPRGDPVLSPQLASDISNLMLLCDAHHRLVDKIDVAGHPVSRLQGMKKIHEARIELLTGIGADKSSHVLLYGAKIGEHDSELSYQKAAEAMVPEKYPAEPRALEIGLNGSPFSDAEASYWAIESESLRRKFASVVKARLGTNDIAHLSIFALAPIPLLINLGRLISDIPSAEIYQLHREPPNWKWKDDPTDFGYSVSSPNSPGKPVIALVLALSANIVADRITAVLGEDVDIWSITHEKPGNDYLQSKTQLRELRKTLRDVFDAIKTTYGENASLHLFPAVPVAAAVEIGRVWMPKADLPFRVYDQNRSTGGFTYALEVR